MGSLLSTEFAKSLVCITNEAVFASSFAIALECDGLVGYLHQSDSDRTRRVAHKLRYLHNPPNIGLDF